jgi:hypothetical protein
MNKPKFKVGDVVTYRFTKDLPNDKYYNGGECHGDNQGIIKHYLDYDESKKCWKIQVTSTNWLYTMLESEFIEFGPLKKTTTKKKTTTINDYAIW